MSYSIGFDGLGSAEVMRMLDSVEKQLNAGAFRTSAEVGAGTDADSALSASAASAACTDPKECPLRIIGHPPLVFYLIGVFVLGLILGLVLRGSLATRR